MRVHTRLNSLAAADLPAAAPYDYDEFERRSSQRRRRAQRREHAHAALAATIVLAVLTGLLLRVSTLTRPMPPAAPMQPERLRDPRTAELERWLHQTTREPAVVRVESWLAVAAIEDRIASIDDLANADRILGSGTREAALDAERARLVQTLAQLRYAETLLKE